MASLHRRFRAAAPFADLSDDAIEAVLADAEMRLVSGGDVIMRQGQVADEAFIVLTGRLRVSVVSRAGERTVVGEAGAGEMLGEMALVAATPRTATVRAIRDSLLAVISRAAFERLIDTHPEVAVGISRLLANRLERANRGGRVFARRRTLALVPSLASVSTAEAGRALGRALAELGSVEVVDRVPAGSPRDAEIAEWVGAMEAASDIVLFVADDPSSAFGRLALRQADHVVIVAEDSDDRAAVLDDVIGLAGSPASPGVDIVVRHATDVREPTGGAAWLALNPSLRVHHIRARHEADLGRIARILFGRDVSLVLSGGGARGYAHIGVHRALEEAGIPVDVVGGASFGSVIGGLIARFETWEAVRDSLYASLVVEGGPVDLTAPAVALTKGARLRDRIERSFGDSTIENLWRRFFAISTDLTDATPRIHTTGSCVDAVRASVAIPGVFPPVLDEDGHLLVDGGVVNNLPIDVMDGFSDGGPRLAVNLRGPFRPDVTDLPPDGIVSGTGAFAKRVLPFVDAPGVPGITDILLRTIEAGAAEHGRRSAMLADHVFRPDVADRALMDFSQLDSVVDAGYRAAVEELESIDVAALLSVRH